MIYLSIYFLSLISLSQAANLIRLAQAPAFAIGFFRLLLAVVLLSLYMVAKGKFKELKTLSTQDRLLSVFAVFIFFIHLYTFFLAAQNTKIANAMVVFSTNPLYTALGAYLIFKEKITLNLGIAYVFALIGLYFLFSHSLDLNTENIFGDTMAFISALLFSFYLLIGRKVRQKVSNLSYIYIMFSVSTIFFGASCVLYKVPFYPYPAITWVSIVGLTVFPTLLGHALFNYALKYLNINFMSCGKILEPLLSASVAYLLFQENLTPQTGIAFLFTGSSLLILFVPPLLRSTLFKKKITLS